MPTHKNVTLRDGSVLTENVTPSSKLRTPGCGDRGFMTSFRKENYVSLTSISPLPVRTESSTVASPTGIRCCWTSTSTPGPLTLASPDRVSTSTMMSCWSSSARTSPLVVFRRAPPWTVTPSRLTSPLKLRTSASFRTVLRMETSPEYDLTMPRTVEFRMSTSPDLLTMSPSTRHSSSVTSPDVDIAGHAAHDDFALEVADGDVTRDGLELARHVSRHLEFHRLPVAAKPETEREAMELSL